LKPRKVNHTQHKIEQRWQLTMVTPLAVLLFAGVIFVRIADGKTAALYYAIFQVPVLLLAAGISRVLSSQFLHRLAQLRRGAERIEAGQFAPLPVGSDEDEFSDLARAFNHMVEVIASREAAQRDQNIALAEVSRRMETVLNATNDGIALVDREGRFALVNRRFSEMLGTRPEALLYRPVSEAQVLITSRLAKPETLMGRLGPFTEEDLTHPIGVAEETIEVVGAERRFIQVYTAPVRDDHREMTGRIIALHDITRETEVDRMKTDFISVVSHELRTPLTSIKGYTDLLLNEQAGTVNEIQREFLTILQGSATRLNNLINDILDISRLESGRVEVKMDRVDYEKIVRDVLRLMKAAADERSISMDAAMPSECTPVCGDADKITQVLTNLVSNAVKYTPKGGWIKVTVEQSDSSVTTCVADSGIGISQDDQKKLFQKFFRADNSSTREAGGTGLGLAIVKTMIELLGGAVWLESEVGKGSSFFFTLPVYGNVRRAMSPQAQIALEDSGLSGGDFADEEIETALARASGGKPDRLAGTLLDRGLGLVLVVDDDIYIREHLQHALHRMGYGVIAGSDPEEVLQRARVHRPDVILLDMMMANPEMAGFTIQRALQEDPATAALPIVAYSLAGDPAHGSLSLGAFSFLRKPIQHNILVKSLREHFGKQRELSVLLVSLADSGGGDEGGVDEFKELREQLLGAHIHLTVETRAETAVGLAIAKQPDAILLDEETGAGQAALFDLLKALKSEEDLSRIPLILLTRSSARGIEHFHFGSDGVELPATLEYLGEQIARVVRSRKFKRSAAAK
jgi:PAS domain S-box-containing protein